MHIASSPTVRFLMKGWKQQAASLQFEKGGSSLPEHLSVKQLTTLYNWNGHKSEEQETELQRYMVNRKINKLRDLKDQNGEWLPPIEIDSRIRSNNSVGREVFQLFYPLIQSTEQGSNQELANSSGWK